MQIKLILILILIKQNNQNCYHTVELIEFETIFNDKIGPLQKISLDYTKIENQKFSLSTWIKYIELDVDQSGETLTALQIGYTDSNNVQK